MKKRQKKQRRERLRVEVDRLLKPETEQAKLWRKLGTVDLSQAFKR
jgi:hypothetical protein